METKKCKKCDEEKLLSEFNKDKYSKDGYRYRCRICTSLEYKNFYHQNKKDEINRQIKYQKNNKLNVNKKRNERHHKKYNSDVLYKLKINVRNRIKHFLKSKNFNVIKNNTYKIVGCTPEELKLHLEKKFTYGMSWDNHNSHGWHIDHIIPLDSVKNEKELYELSHYTNLQPLWCGENYKKGKKIL